MKQVLVTGASGFTGSEVVPLLLERGFETTCLVRPSSDRSAVDLPGVRFVIGDIDEPDSLEAALRNKDALVHIAYLSRGSEEKPNRAEGIVRACRAAGVRRAVFVSSTSIFTTMNAPAKNAKLAAEQAVVNSGLDYTILRPTMIYGTAGDRNMIRLVRLLRRSPVMLVPGDGGRLQQPVHVADLARAIVDCLSVSDTIGKAYNLSGPEPVTFNEIIRETCRALGVRRLVIHVPLEATLWAARLMTRLQKRTWIKEERLLRLNEDKCFDHAAAHRDFGFSPRSFAEGIRQEIQGYIGYSHAAP